MERHNQVSSSLQHHINSGLSQRFLSDQLNFVFVHSQSEDVTKYLFPPYVAPAGIKPSGGARDKRKTSAQAANSLALSTADFLAAHENDREEARAAASKLIPKTVPAPKKAVGVPTGVAPPPPIRVGRQGRLE